VWGITGRSALCVHSARICIPRVCLSARAGPRSVGAEASEWLRRRRCWGRQVSDGGGEALESLLPLMVAPFAVIGGLFSSDAARAEAAASGPRQGAAPAPAPFAMLNPFNWGQPAAAAAATAEEEDEDEGDSVWMQGEECSGGGEWGGNGSCLGRERTAMLWAAEGPGGPEACGGPPLANPVGGGWLVEEEAWWEEDANDAAEGGEDGGEEAAVRGEGTGGRDGGPSLGTRITMVDSALCRAKRLLFC
jgi:hypothetical protein